MNACNKSRGGLGLGVRNGPGGNDVSPTRVAGSCRAWRLRITCTAKHSETAKLGTFTGFGACLGLNTSAVAWFVSTSAGGLVRIFGDQQETEE